ncbi:MAG: hypothetical protein HZA17_09745 [Nitrospirae bacterium]|nr:hypothetical protein [Nitrospirota bacterium]
MILHPGILAILAGSGITLILLSSAAILGLKIVRKWDIRDSSEEQLALERRTYLVSTLVQYGLLFEVMALFLFIYTADDIHNLLVGAMCATGSLNANAFGFPALYFRVASLFLAAAWIALNHIDQKAEDYPLTKKKYAMLLFIIPVTFAGYILELRYFLNIEPNVITSCCGVLFSEGGTGAGSSLASLPAQTMKTAFFTLSLIMAASGISVIRTQRNPYAFFLAAVSFIYLIVSITSVISFISLYFYQLPTHHCPFDILQPEYYYIGYPLYASLFSGTFFGMMSGIIEPLKKIKSLSHIIPGLQRRWALFATSAIILFVIITLIPMVFSTFTLERY